MSAPIERLLDTVEWQKLPPPRADNGLPFATHEGVLEFGEARLRCYQLSTGVRVFDADDIEAFFGEAVS